MSSHPRSQVQGYLFLLSIVCLIACIVVGQQTYPEMYSVNSAPKLFERPVATYPVLTVMLGMLSLGFGSLGTFVLLGRSRTLGTPTAPAA